jgi:hypothetical protein
MTRRYDANEWFQGVFWWAWWTDPLAGSDFTNLFTPQNKPVLNVLREYYGGKNNMVGMNSLGKIMSDGVDGSPYWCGVTQG